MANVIQTFPKGTGSGGGHTILDGEGTALTQEKNLQIEGLDVADDSTNEATVFSPIGLNADSIDDIAEANTINPVITLGEINNYSTKEKAVGKWIDGKTLYQKTVNCGTLVNAGEISVAHNITNLDKIVYVRGSMISSNGMGYPLPYTSGNSAYNVYVNTTLTNIVVGTANNGWTGINAYVTLQYTKTT